MNFNARFSEVVRMVDFSVYVIALVFTTLVYSNSLGGSFVFDDQAAIVDNLDVRPESPWGQLLSNDFWGTAMHLERSHKSYRPLTVASFKLNYHLAGGPHPFSFHAVNLILHLCVTALVIRLAELFAPQYSDSASLYRFRLLSGLLFGLHPIHVEAVTGIVGRAELLSAIFYVSGLILFTRQSEISFVLALVCIPLATLCKETGVTVAGVMIAYQCCTDPTFLSALKSFNLSRNCVVRLSTGRNVRVMAVTCLTLLLRLRMNGPGRPHFTWLDNPAAHEATPVRQINFAYLPVVNIGLLLHPLSLICDWCNGTVPLIVSIRDSRIFLMFGFYASSVWYVLRSLCSSSNVIFLSLLVFPFLPAANIFFPVGFVVAERVLYLPSIGFCCLVAHGLSTWLARKSSQTVWKLKIFAIAILLLGFGWKTHTRNGDWTNERTLFTSGLRHTQSNCKMFNNVGHTYQNGPASDQLIALAYFRKACQVEPRDAGAFRNVAETYRRLGRLQEAAVFLRRAVSLLTTNDNRSGSRHFRLSPMAINSRLDLAVVLVDIDAHANWPEAERLIDETLTMRPDYAFAEEKRGECLAKLKRWEDAKRAFQRALQLRKSGATDSVECPGCWYNLAVLNRESPQPGVDSFDLLDKCLKEDRFYDLCLMAYASYVTEFKREDLYEQALQHATTLAELTTSRFEFVCSGIFQRALLLARLHRAIEAEASFRSLLQLQPGHTSALFNSAFLRYEQADKFKETASENSQIIISTLRQLLSLQPIHEQGHILLGMVLQNLTPPSLLQAKEAYAAAYRLGRANREVARHAMCHADALINAPKFTSQTEVQILQQKCLNQFT